MKRLILTALLFASCTIAPQIPKPRIEPVLVGNSVMMIIPTHDAKGKFTGFSVDAGYVELLNSLYDGWGYLLTPPRKAGFGITPAEGGGFIATGETERNRIILEKYRDMEKSKQGIMSKIADHL